MKEQKIKDLPMMTVDGVEIKVGTKLFVADQVRDNYDSVVNKTIYIPKIREYTVVYTNNSARKFKILKDDKTEADFGMYGRAIAEFFGKRPNAVKVAVKKTAEKIKEMRAMSVQAEKIVKKLRKAIQKF